MDLNTSVGPIRRRRSTKIARTASAECSLTPGNKRRLRAYCEMTGVSESEVLAGLVVEKLDREGVADPGEATETIITSTAA